MEVKDLYEEVGRNYRHFLSWREKIFGGYLAVLAALVTAYHTAHDRETTSIIILAGFIVSIIFWLLEARNRMLYSKTQETGCRLERLYIESGHFTAMTEMRDRYSAYSPISHSFAIDFLVAVVVLFLIYISIPWQYNLHLTAISLATVALAMALTFLLGAIDRSYRNRWKREKADYDLTRAKIIIRHSIEFRGQKYVISQRSDLKNTQQGQDNVTAGPTPS